MPMSPVEQSELAKHVAVVEFVSRCLKASEVVVPVGSPAPTTAIKAFIKMWLQSSVPTSLRAKILELATLPFPPPYSPERYAGLGDADKKAWRQRVRGATLERAAVLNARNSAHVKALHDHVERGLGGGERGLGGGELQVTATSTSF